MNEIRDPIHGFITPTDPEVKIINTSVFQRLRKINQLAMAYLVYPGANHTRFDHSLGVYHIASLMADKLLPDKENEDKRQIVRFAALLHDIGHGPFSHISEDILERYAETDDGSSKEKIHEKITMKLINTSEELGNLLSPEEKKKIIGLLSGESVDIPLMREIVSGPLDADKMDYLLRDSYFCGVKYGVFDLERILNTLMHYKEDFAELMGINYDGINSLEQFVLAKYYMMTQVYCHKVRSVSDAMIIRGIELGIEMDKIDFLQNLYCYKDTEEYLDNYLKYWDDRVIIELVFGDKKGYASDIFERLNRRNLFKRIFSKKFKALEIEKNLKDKLINITNKKNKELRKKLEEKIATLVPCEKEYVIVNSFAIKSVREMSRDSEGKIMIIDDKGNKKAFEEESTVFSSIDESMMDMYFEVYTPLEYASQQEKYKKKRELDEKIIEILKGE
jgi:hypothetical protein